MFDDGEVKFRRDIAEDLRTRAKVLRDAFRKPIRATEYEKVGLSGDDKADVSAEQLGWEIESIGGYYAFVKHPFNKGSNGSAQVTSTQVAEALASLVGVGILPADFFMPTTPPSRPEDGSTQADIAANRLRISIANVNDSTMLEEVPIRLGFLTRLWQQGKIFQDARSNGSAAQVDTPDDALVRKGQAAVEEKRTLLETSKVSSQLKGEWEGFGV
jgi:hypothetical protein